jgi:hypothetical protein
MYSFFLSDFNVKYPLFLSYFNVKYSLFLSDFNETNFLDRFEKDTQIPHFMKIRPVGDELFHAEGRRDMTKLMTAYRNFANAHKSLYFRAQSIHLNL